MANRSPSIFTIIAPGILLAATGVGAGDLLTATLAGSEVGLAVLWAAVAGAILKWTLNEGLARWQLATDSTLLEGWARHLGGDWLEARSAGIEAHGKNPRAIAIMKESGIDISGQESSIVSDAMMERTDIVVTVCGHADEQCPVLPFNTKKVHWPLSDPAKATGTEEEITEIFRATRDEVEIRVRDLLKQFAKPDYS